MAKTLQVQVFRATLTLQRYSHIAHHWDDDHWFFKDFHELETYFVVFNSFVRAFHLHAPSPSTCHKKTIIFKIMKLGLINFSSFRWQIKMEESDIWIVWFRRRKLKFRCMTRAQPKYYSLINNIYLTRI